jgi:hypothetical protein
MIYFGYWLFSLLIIRSITSTQNNCIMSKADFMEDSFIKLMGTWDNDATWRITETPHAEFLKARNIPVNDAVDILFTDCIYEPLEGEQLPQLLRQMRANAVSLVRCPDSPSSRRAWLDDRNAENATGGYRQYSNPLTPVQLYERLKQPVSTMSFIPVAGCLTMLLALWSS